jgi:hypothetical protein
MSAECTTGTTVGTSTARTAGSSAGSMMEGFASVTAVSSMGVPDGALIRGSSGIIAGILVGSFMGIPS